MIYFYEFFHSTLFYLFFHYEKLSLWNPFNQLKNYFIIWYLEFFINYYHIQNCQSLYCRHFLHSCLHEWLDPQVLLIWLMHCHFFRIFHLFHRFHLVQTIYFLKNLNYIISSFYLARHFTFFFLRYSYFYFQNNYFRANFIREIYCNLPQTFFRNY